MTAIAEQLLRPETVLIKPERYGFEVLGEGLWRKELGGEVIQFEVVHWRDLESLRQVEDLQLEAWGWDGTNPEQARSVVPGHLLSIAADTGGSLIIARGEKTGSPEGFVLTYGTIDGGLILHMIATTKNQKYKRDLGWNLAVLQAAEATRKGISQIEWTYDPLIGGNARLYLEKLGAVANKYTVNKYGKILGIYGEDPTDRLTVHWDLSDPKVIERIEQVEDLSYLPASLEEVADLPVLDVSSNGDTPVEFLLEIPGTDPDLLDPEEKIVWRQRVRKVLCGLLDTENDKGLTTGHMEITGLASGYVDGVRRNYYIVERRQNGNS